MPSPPSLMPAAVVSRESDDRRTILLRSVEADLEGTGLATWEAQFCRWLALHGNTKRSRQIEVASALAGTTVTSQQLVHLRCRPAWKALWIKERDVETALKKAKADYSMLIEESASQYREMLGIAVRDKDVRAATALLTPLLDRAVPKKDETERAAPDVHIHLSVQQAKNLEAVPLDVSAEEVQAEFTVESE